MFCSKCGAENPDSAKFCKGCGNPTKASVHPVHANNSGMASENNIRNAWDCFLGVFRKYATFNGRASRREFWSFAFFNFIFTFLIVSIDHLLGSKLLFYAYTLVLAFPSLSVTVRRLHDTGRSGWMYLIFLIPIAGPIILLVFMATKGTPSANQYGPSPQKGC